MQGILLNCILGMEEMDKAPGLEEKYMETVTDDWFSSRSVKSDMMRSSKI